MVAHEAPPFRHRADQVDEYLAANRSSPEYTHARGGSPVLARSMASMIICLALCHVVPAEIFTHLPGSRSL